MSEVQSVYPFGSAPRARRCKSGTGPTWVNVVSGSPEASFAPSEGRDRPGTVERRRACVRRPPAPGVPGPATPPSEVPWHYIGSRGRTSSPGVRGGHRTNELIPAPHLSAGGRGGVGGVTGGDVEGGWGGGVADLPRGPRQPPNAHNQDKDGIYKVLDRVTGSVCPLRLSRTQGVLERVSAGGFIEFSCKVASF